MKKILIVSPFFKPFAGVGANRMDSLVDYLYNKLNYDITIVKNENSSYMNILKGYSDTRKIKRIEVQANSNFLISVRMWKKKIRELLQASKYDSVIISAGPFYTLPLVKYIKRMFAQCTVILDLRDFWAHEPIVNMKKSKLYISKEYIKDLFFERPALKATDFITVTGAGERDVLSYFYGERIKQKTYAIYNGFDERTTRDLSVVKKKEIDEKLLNVCVFGKFSEYMNDYERGWLKEGVVNSDIPINFIQIGSEEHKLKILFDDTNVSYNSTGYLDYNDGMRYIKKNVDVCLVSGDLSVGLGTKVYDYIVLDKPILFIGNKNIDLARFVNSFENGFVCNSIEDVSSAIRSIANKKIDCLDPNLDSAKYSREKQNMKFEKIINGLYKEA